MVISHELTFVFLGIPRTANRAMHRALCQLPGAYHHGKLHTMEIPQQCRTYFTFCAVRNPYRRFLAYYLWRRQPHPWGSDAAGMSFEDYLSAAEAGQLGSMTVRGHTRDVRLDAVIRYEQLPDSLYGLAHIRGIETVRLEPSGRRLSRHWQSYYTDYLAGRVYELTKPDFDEFGYDVNSWRE